jgi:AcrR family transcriptional regulator
VTTAGPGTRQQRAQETRDRLFFAACELFVAKGYAGTTVDSIAARAGVAKGTFFVHFKTKDAVATQLIVNQTNAARRAREKALAIGGTVVDAMIATVLALGRQAGASKMLSRAVLASTLESGEVAGDSSELFEGIFEMLRADALAARRAGLLARSADPERVAWSLLASYLGAVLSFATNPRAVPLVDTLAPLVEATLEAAKRPPPRARRKR